VQKIIIEEACAEGHATTTGRRRGGRSARLHLLSRPAPPASPRGRCASTPGLLNHLNAKIDDLGVGPAHGAPVVAQTAPQCFDISLWQLVSALLVGGTNLIVEQEVILDVARYVDTIVRGRVGVLQVVPSYLEVVLTYLEQHPRSFPTCGACRPPARR
jgi:non-ribosomal peptide synthetase component F